MIRNIFLLCVLIIGGFDVSAQYNYPITKTVDSSGTYFGVTYKDPYRWLENLKDSNVVNWFKAQEEFTNSAFTNSKGEDKMLQELADYMQSNTWERGPVYKSATRYYYSKRDRNQRETNLYYRTIQDTAEHLIYKSWSIHAGMRYNVLNTVFSPNEKYILVAFDRNGEEYPFIKIYDIFQQRWMADSIPHCWYSTIDWSADSKGFIYAYNTGDRNAPNATENNVVKYHALHTSYKDDKTILDDKLRNLAEKKISNSYSASLYFGNNKKRVYINPNQGFEFDYGNVFYCNTNEILSPAKKWIRLYSGSDSVITAIETDAGYYFVSAKGKGSKSLRFTPFTKPDFANAKIILPEDSNWQLEYVDETKSYLLVNYSKYGFLDKTIFINKQTGKQVPVSVIADADRYEVRPISIKTDECIFYKKSVNKPGWSYLLDIAKNKITNEDFWAPHGQTFIEGSDNIVTELIEVPSYDGTLVPMSIMRDKNTKLDGSNICLLYGYGAYGLFAKDNFFNEYSSINNVFVKRGVILVHAYVRGGGEKGETWHAAGMKENKPNSWKDFIACAEYLINNNYTQSAKLGCFGGSAGGVLIGRAITERPDLFAAATIQSGTLNLIRAKAWANSINNFPEFGNPEIESEMKGLIEMDAVIHVKPDVKYPAVYITTGFNDSRVAPWMPGKMAAILQANNTSGKPVLLHTDFEGGHIGGENATSVVDMLRTQLKILFFLLWQCGDKDFQLK
ncbi:MAG: prolyl oligopeptidase family serine peptidase [Chitinophagaceae bacterium]